MSTQIQPVNGTMKKTTDELIKDLNEWKKGKFHYCSDELTEEKNCHSKTKLFGDMLCKDCYKGFRIREVHLQGRLDILEDEWDFLNNLLGQARYENAMLTREDILKRIKNLTNDIEKIKKSITN